MRRGANVMFSARATMSAAKDLQAELSMFEIYGISGLEIP